MIKVSNLAVTYPGADKPVLKGIDLEIEKGAFVAIVGRNGCGKSTLCKVLNGLIPKFTQGDFSGQVWVEGVDLSTLSISDIATYIGYVYQDFDNQIVKPKVLDDVAFGPMNFAYKDYEARALKALADVGILDLKDKFVWDLSGGQRHLVALAGVLALGPQVLILDEPIAQYCSQLVLMEAGQVAMHVPVMEGLQAVDRLMGQGIHPPQLTQIAHELSKKFSQEASGNADRLPIHFDEALPWYRGLFVTQPKAYEAFYSMAFPSTAFPNMAYTNPGLGYQAKPSQPTQPLKEPVLTFKGVGLGRKNMKQELKPVLKEVNLEVFKGERLAIVGQNGAGKTTMLKLLTGLMRPDKGDIVMHTTSEKAMQGQAHKVAHLPIHRLSPEVLGDKVAYVYQNPEEMFIMDSIQSDIQYGMKSRKYDHYSDRAQALLATYQLSDLGDRDGRMLSGGQMRRASMAIGVSLYPRVLLLDEPTANLDIGTRRALYKTMQELDSHCDAVIIATHDMQLVLSWASRVVVMQEGAIIAQGPPLEIFANQDLMNMAGLLRPPVVSLKYALDDLEGGSKSYGSYQGHLV